MKNIILSGLLLFSSATFSQIISNLECGWNYHYDVGGNRIARVFVNCTPSSHLVPSASDTTDAMAVVAGIENDTLANVDIFTLYPNPTKDAFNLEFNNALDNAEVTVRSNTGQLVYSQKVSGTAINIDLSGQAASTYHVVVIRNANQQYTKSVVKVD